MEKTSKIYGIFRGLAMMLMALAAVCMIFCDGEEASLTELCLAKAGGFGLAWIIFRLTPLK